jgi:hypothetical protein
MRLRFALAAALLSTTSCGNSDEERPPAPSCPDGICVTPSPPGRPTGSSGGGSNDAGTLERDAGALATTTLAGTVGVVSTEDFSLASDYLDLGVVGAEGATGRVTAEFTGPEYSLGRVLRDPQVWVDVEPTTTTLDLFPTIQRADAESGAADLVLVRTTTLETIGAGLLSPVDLLPERGHVVFRFVDGQGSGVPGIALDNGTFPESVVAYDTGTGIFRDDQPDTTNAGYAALLSVDAIPFPGAVAEVTFSGAATGVVAVKLAAASVTVLTVVVD